MKVMLVMPPPENTIVMEAPNEVVEEFGAYPPLGLMYIASCIRDKTNHEVIIVDCDSDRLNFVQLEQKIKEYRPDVVGITAYTPIIFDALRVAKLIKQINPDTVTIMGGHHSDIYPQETYRLGNIDYMLKGESEYTFPQLLQAIESNTGFEEIKGLTYRKEVTDQENDNNNENISEKIVSNPGYGFVDDLDELPLPARDLIDWTKHQCILGREKHVATIMSSRGCPYRCTFCYKPLDSRSYRMRSALSIIKEIEKCYELGLREIFFFDDNFSVSPKRVEEICDELIRRKIKITWSFRGRVNTINPQMLRKCKKSGCHRIHFGVETGTDEGLSKLKKDINTDMVRKAFRLCKKAGIITISNFIIGLPWEKKEDMFKTVKFANEIGADFAEFQILTPYPKTELYETRIQEGKFNDFWLEFAKNPNTDFRLRTCNDYYNREELFVLLEQCLKKFYFNPRRAIKILFQIKSGKELMTKAKAGLALFNFKEMIFPKKVKTEIDFNLNGR
jgi:anaerobic magnesium-protoporphyrin IX monomethyl ester cyclase